MNKQEAHEFLVGQGWQLVKGSTMCYQRDNEEAYVYTDFDGNAYIEHSFGEEVCSACGGDGLLRQDEIILDEPCDVCGGAV